MGNEIYIVTGATGFIGNNIVRELVLRGEKVRCFVRNPDKAEKVLDGLDVEIMTGTLAPGGGFESAFTGGDGYVVVHAAGLVALGNKKRAAQLEEDNVNATVFVTDTAKSCGARKLIFISSVHAFPEPKKGSVLSEPDKFDCVDFREGYGRTKAKATKYVLDAAGGEFETVSLHPSGVCGPFDPGETYLTKLIIQYNAGRIPAGVKGGYDFVDVRDVAIAAAESAKPGRRGCYFLTGNYVTVREMFGYLAAALNKKPKKLMLPMWTAKASLPILTLYAKVRRIEPLYTSYSLSTLSQNAAYLNEKAKRELGFSPRPMAESIQAAAAYLKESGRL